MAIVRMIFVSVGPQNEKEALHVWKTECAPLMIKQNGCLSEQLLQCLDAPGEFISYQEWTDRAAIDRYLASPAHEEIKQHARSPEYAPPRYRRTPARWSMSRSMTQGARTSG